MHARGRLPIGQDFVHEGILGTAFTLAPSEARDIVRVAEMIKTAAREQLPVVHPENPGIAGITIDQAPRPAPHPRRPPPQHRRRHKRQARLPPRRR